MRQQQEDVASGAKAPIRGATHGGAKAPPFRTTIHEMTSNYYFLLVAFCTHCEMMSTGSGKTMVVFFSTPISVSVCK